MKTWTIYYKATGTQDDEPIMQVDMDASTENAAARLFQRTTGGFEIVAVKPKGEALDETWTSDVLINDALNQMIGRPGEPNDDYALRS